MDMSYFNFYFKCILIMPPCCTIFLCSGNEVWTRELVPPTAYLDEPTPNNHYLVFCRFSWILVKMLDAQMNLPLYQHSLKAHYRRVKHAVKAFTHLVCYLPTFHMLFLYRQATSNFLLFSIYRMSSLQSAGHRLHSFLRVRLQRLCIGCALTRSLWSVGFCWR